MPEETKRQPIFDANDFRRLKRLQSELQHFTEEIEKCQQCGINCDNECTMVEGGKFFSDKLEELFFNPPPREIAQLME